MTLTEAKKLKAGNRIKWYSNDDYGTVVRVTPILIEVRWDDQDAGDMTYVYDLDGKPHGIMHLVKVAA